MIKKQYDLVVIEVGSAAMTAAMRTRAAGRGALNKSAFIAGLCQAITDDDQLLGAAHAVFDGLLASFNKATIYEHVQYQRAPH